ncbi:MAG: indolepyruvate oxidoreductase subunit beta [Chloroherpetonaceae bacterium]|jgi:indolepyruvate ferredoxin oxidoreductase beta subunit|nr:indolepyruvate oxidoreductase subunit beta [bacterium]
MKRDIIIAGVGGQGIISIASAIGFAAIEAGLFFKQNEVHGMSQRGGEVVSNFRISDKPIHSDLIPEGEADLIISMEPLETLRYVNYLSPEGWIISNDNPFVNMPNYPDVNLILASLNNYKNALIINADEIARKLGNSKATNMVLLGAASPYIGIDYEILENSIRTIFGRKGEKIIELNLKAMQKGKEFALEKA